MPAVNGPAAGRDGVLKFGGKTVGKVRNWKYQTAVALISDGSMDSEDPEVLHPGDRKHTFSAEMLWINSVWANSILAQASTGMSVVIYPMGTGAGEMKITLNNALFTRYGLSADKDGAILDHVEGEAKTVTIGVSS